MEALLIKNDVDSKDDDGDDDDDCSMFHRTLARSLGESGQVEPETEALLIENDVDSCDDGGDDNDDCSMFHRTLARSLGEAGQVEPETEALLIENDVDSSEFSDEVQLCGSSAPTLQILERAQFTCCIHSVYGLTCAVAVLVYHVCCGLIQVKLNSLYETDEVPPTHTLTQTHLHVHTHTSIHTHTHTHTHTHIH